MALQTNGYVTLPFNAYDTYNHWREYCLTHGIDVDYTAGNQCFDVPALLWHQYHLFLMTRPQGNGVAWMCWKISRAYNARLPFIAVEGVENIKRGDCLVFDANPWSSTGHICFADDDYANKYWDSDTGCWRLKCLGQNQGQGIGWGAPSNIKGINLQYFLGIFRNTTWVGTAPEPPKPKPLLYNKDKYNFVLYNRRKRQTKWTKTPKTKNTTKPLSKRK